MKHENSIFFASLVLGAATILMSDSGALYACGENNDNRLGLTEDSWTSWFTYEPADDDHKVLTPTKIKGIKQVTSEFLLLAFLDNFRKKSGSKFLKLRRYLIRAEAKF